MVSGSNERGRGGVKVLLGIGLVAPVLAAFALMPSGASGGVKGSTHDHAVDAEMAQELAQVRRATARFHEVDEAIAAGYELGWVNGSGARIVGGCVAHPTAGAMGYHYFNAALMADNDVDALQPEVLVYAPESDGGLKLVAAEWVVRSAQSNPPGVPTAPSVLGMDMHILVPPPGPAFYLLHAWVWANNPAGMFADFNPKISCHPRRVSSTEPAGETMVLR
ncbi:MAG: hypothetical protein ABWZ91_15230 [Nocardioides sp.]